MIVNLKPIGPGAAHTAPKATPAPAVRPSAPKELFDANGDGAIENWSVVHGGDSFETLDPAPAGTDLTRAHRSSDPAPASGLPATTGHRAHHRDTPAAIHHAHDAYRRDGTPMPQAAGRTPLPSPG